MNDAPHVMILPCLHFDVFGKCLLSLKSYNNAWYTKELSFFCLQHFQRGIEFLRPINKIVKAYVIVCGLGKNLVTLVKMS